MNPMRSGEDGSRMAIRRAIRRQPQDVEQRREGRRPAKPRRCVMAVAGCTAGPAQGRGRLRAWRVRAEHTGSTDASLLKKGPKGENCGRRSGFCASQACSNRLVAGSRFADRRELNRKQQFLLLSAAILATFGFVSLSSSLECAEVHSPLGSGVSFIC